MAHSADITYESGFYYYPNYDSVCVSSQAGCNVGCRFCVTGQSINRHNLVPEILAQVTAAGPFRRGGYPLKVSFQGMGEPLHNYISVVKAIETLRSGQSLADLVGISTVGFPKLIDRLRFDAPGVKLQIWLHAPDDELRHWLIPQSRGVSTVEVLGAARRYSEDTGAKLVFNYLLLADLNDTPGHAVRLAELVRPYLTTGQLKISRYNVDPTLPYQPSEERAVLQFSEILQAAGVSIYKFRSKGVDISSGCGQLRRNATHAMGEL